MADMAGGYRPPPGASITRWGRTARWRTPWAAGSDQGRGTARRRRAHRLRCSCSCRRSCCSRRSFEYLEVDRPRRRAPSSSATTYIDEDDGICVNVEDIDDRVYFSDDTFLGAQGYYWVASILILVVLQGLTGWTPGKLLTGIRVEARGRAARRASSRRALRWVLWIVDGFPYFIPGLTGFIVALSTPGHRRVGDMAAKTFVVKRAAVEHPDLASRTAAG